MTINYTTYTAQISNLLVIPSSDPNFITMLPGMIDYAEQRIYRELDLLTVQVTDATTTVSSGNRNFVTPTSLGTYIIVDNINIITPSTATADTGSRNQLVPTSREFLDMCYPSGQALVGVPQFWAMASPTQILFGPAPDAPYVAEVVGIQRPAPLSAMNSSTILTQYIPDVFIAASMIFGGGYMRDYGSMYVPESASFWDGQYKELIQSAQVEQFRAKYQSQGWTSNQPSPLVQRQ